MSEVWLAADRELAREVALKLHALHADPARFEREARAAAALSHENIAAVYDYGQADDRPFLVLEYLPGSTLEQRLPGGEPLPDAETHRIAAELAAGLGYAHAHGVIHRDLKPSNVLFDAEDRAKLVDFGIARAAGFTTLTEAGTVLGTAAYISPEQAAGDPVGPESDVYSFGVILFRMLAGRLPFEAEHPLELALKHRDEPPPDVRSVRPDAPAALAALAAATLAKEPRARPRDGAALAAALEDPATIVLPPPAAPEEADATRVLRPPEPPRRRLNRRRLVGGLAALVVLAGAGTLAAVLATGGGTAQAPSTLSRKTTARHTTSQATTAPVQTQTTTPASTAPTTTAPATTTPATTLPTTTAPTTAPTTTAALATTGTTATNGAGT